MIRIDKLIEELSKFPPDARAYAHEENWEYGGLVIMAAEPKYPTESLGFIVADESEPPTEEEREEARKLIERLNQDDPNDELL